MTQVAQALMGKDIELAKHITHHHSSRPSSNFRTPHPTPPVAEEAEYTTADTWQSTTSSDHLKTWRYTCSEAYGCQLARILCYL
jgi:hypothetical protein